MIKQKTIELLGKKFQLNQLKLKYATEIMDYQSSKLAIPYEFKVECIIDGVKLIEEGHPVRMTEETINTEFMSHPSAFTLLFSALVKLTFEDDQKKSEEYLKAASSLIDL